MSVTGRGARYRDCSPEVQARIHRAYLWLHRQGYHGETHDTVLLRWIQRGIRPEDQ